MENKTMNSNTSNYQEYTLPKLFEQYDRVLVPMIQRDYAQGRTDKKASDVRNNLLNDIFSDKKVHFDLVFGSKEQRIIDGVEMNCFIPVDGQQRLTTLFLLYLYGQKAGRINTELDLSKFSYDTRRAASDFCKSITSEEWAVPNNKNVSDVIKDSSWFMNYWEKDPTVEGMLTMLDAIHEKCNKVKFYLDLSKVTFYFFDLESNGLNENLYLKMNSRGKPLTAFENLKAKMEKVLPEDVENKDKCFPQCDALPKDGFKEKWKYFMDRNWTETFWDTEHPEKYDEYITKFIVRFLSGYWEANNKDEEKNTANELESFNSDENYNDFVPFEPIEKVLKLENAFPSLAYALTTLPKITTYWTNDAIKVSDKSEYKFLAVIFTYVLFDGDKDAMRFAWNMAENYVTGYDNFITYCKCAEKIHKCLYGENISFYKALSSLEIDGNTSDQLAEEISKAKQILKGEQRPDGKTWEEIIIEVEKYAFFKGAIRFLFTDGEGNINWCDFDKKWANVKKYFDENGEMAKDYQEDAILLRYYISKFKKWWEFWGFTYDNKPSTWKQLLISNRYLTNHNVLMELLNENYDFSVFKSNLEECDLDYKERQEMVQNELVKTNILIESSKWSMKLNWRGDHNTYCLYPYKTKAEWKIYVIANKRNQILSQLHKTKVIKTEQQIKNCDFFCGWDIYFNYPKNVNPYTFQWNTDNYIYLINKNERMKKDSGSYYRFSTKGIDNHNTFTKELDCLIAQAFPNESDKICCQNCQDKSCM